MRRMRIPACRGRRNSSREQARKVREQAQNAAESSRALDVPPANLALFEKHKEEIPRSTMGGLELLPI